MQRMWTLTQTDRRRLEAFEMWIWRRMEKISWLNKVTSEKSAQRRRKHCTLCSKVEPKIFTPPQNPFPGARDGQNLISWRWSLPLPANPVWWGSMHAISSYHGNRPTQTHSPTHNTQTDRTNESRMKGKPTRGRRIQMLQDLANNGGFVALKRAAENEEGWRQRERMSKTCYVAEDWRW